MEKKEEALIDIPNFGILRFLWYLYRTLSVSERDLTYEHVKFGKHEPKIIIKDYKEAMFDLYQKTLSCLFELQNEITENLYQETIKYCDEEGIRNSSDNPIIYVTDHFIIDEIMINTIDGQIMLTVWGRAYNEYGTIYSNPMKIYISMHMYIIQRNSSCMTDHIMTGKKS